MCRDKAGVCRCLTGLVKKGLVWVEPVSYKCLRVHLSDSAVAIKPQVLQVAENRHRALIELLSPEELDAFTMALDKIIKHKTK